MDDSLRQVLGVCFIGIGVLSAVFHLLRATVRLPFEPFRALPALQRAWGPRAGLAAHVLGQVVVPIVIGLTWLAP